MLEAKRCILSKQSCPRLIVAGEQSQGKGRFGRIWFAPKGNLYLTLVQPAKHSIDQIPIIVGMAVAEVLMRLISSHQPDAHQNNTTGIVTLKHPNDVLIDGKKICGILIEKWDDLYSVGVGINVASSPVIQDYETTYMQHYNPTITVGFLLRCFLRRYQSLLQADFRTMLLLHPFSRYAQEN